ncbi:MAG: FMN-binding protein [Bdellovibrionota bacterium]
MIDKRISAVSLLASLYVLESAHAASFENLEAAVLKALKVKSKKDAVQKPVKIDGKEEKIPYSKDKSGKPAYYAFIEKGLYPPNCTHTWVIGIDAKTSKVNDVRVVEMSCHHAFPTKEPTWLEQFMGKGPADVATLDDDIDTIAKATGSSKLATDAVKRAITKAEKAKGKI